MSCPSKDQKMSLQRLQPANTTESNRVKPIIQSYSMTPSFAHVRTTRPVFPHHHPIRNIHPKPYPPRRPNYFGNSNSTSSRPAHFSSGAMLSKRSSKVWIRPSETNTSNSTVGNTSNAISTIQSVDSVKSVPSVIRSHFVFGENKIALGLEKQIQPKFALPISTTPVRSIETTGRSDPLKPIVPLHNKMRFKLVKPPQKIPLANVSNNGHGSSASLKSLYKLDRRSKLYSQGSDIARMTIIAGLNLTQRRSTIAASVRKSFQNKSVLKSTPYTKINSPMSFIVRQYSMKRIRKVSYKKSPVKTCYEVVGTHSITSSVKNERRVSKSSILCEDTVVSGSKLELSSLSFSQNPTVRLATRFVQRSRQHLASSKSKKNTFCNFYNRLGTCKRLEEGTCSYVHDRRQLQICSKFLMSEKCDSKDCKLSHDLNVGKIPPCRFFNEGSCSRETCRYLHVFSNSRKTLRQNKSRRASSQIEKLQTLNKPKDSIIHKKDSVETNADKIEEKSRYFEISPNSQPILAIIPRRYPKGVLAAVKAAEDEQSESSGSEQSEPPDKDNSSNDDQVVEVPSTSGGTKVLESDNIDHRRQRLLGKLSKLKNDLKQNVSKAPSFLGFNSL